MADDGASTRAAAKAKAVRKAKRLPLTPEQRKECKSLRSKAYHAERKATKDTTLAARAGMKAKEEYLKTLGHEFKGTLRGPRQCMPKATEPVPEAEEAAPMAQPAAKKPRSIKQLQCQEQVKEAMAELQAQGLQVSIAAAARLITNKKSAALGAWIGRLTDVLCVSHILGTGRQHVG